MHRGRFAQVAVAGVAALSAGMAVSRALAPRAVDRFRDLQVYRQAGHVVWHMPAALYTFRTPHGAPFTYPPSVGMLLSPLAHLSLVTGGLVLAGLTLCCVAAVLAITGRQLWPGSRHGTLLLGLGGALLYTLPFKNTISLGQVDALLLLLVVVDLLVVPPQVRGISLGLAAAVKLTPLLFVPYLLMARQLRAATLATATFLGVGVVGVVARPDASRQFWLHSVWDTSRVGRVDDPRNRSVAGLLGDIGMTRPLATVLVLVAAGVVVWRAPRLPVVAAVGAVGCTASLITPLTWSHHLVWISVAVPVLMSRPGFSRACAVVTLLCFIQWPGETIAVSAHVQTVAAVACIAALLRVRDQELVAGPSAQALPLAPSLTAR